MLLVDNKMASIMLDQIDGLECITKGDSYTGSAENIVLYFIPETEETYLCNVSDIGFE